MMKLSGPTYLGKEEGGGEEGGRETSESSACHWCWSGVCYNRREGGERGGEREGEKGEGKKEEQTG